MSVLVLSLLLLLLPSSCQSQECSAIIKEWMDAPETLPPIVYADSGKFLNDLGDYNNCNHNNDHYVFFTLTVLNRLAQGMQNIGLCIPKECYQDLSNNVYAPKIQDKLNAAFQTQTNSSFLPFQNLHFYDPLTNQPEMDWTNHLTIALFALLLTLGLVGSIVPRLTKS